MTYDGVTYDKFLQTIPEIARYYEWRYGQALFNALTKIRPQLAEKVRGTTIDPFYRDHADIAPELFSLLQGEWDAS